MLFNTLDIREVFGKIRSMNLDEKHDELLRPPQPGLFLGNKILFIGQNPGYPRPAENPSDRILLDENSTDFQFHEAYKQSQLNWKFYKKFINPIIGDSMDFSITNVCFFPTKDNQSPSDEAITACEKNLLELVDIISPEIIICCGNMAKQIILQHKLKEKYKIIFAQHYSYLLRTGNIISAIEDIKEEIKNYGI